MLQNFIDENQDKLDEDITTKANQELKRFWERNVADIPRKTAAFAGVLRELRSAITIDENVLEWYVYVMKPVVGESGHRKPAIEDAQEFLSSVMIYEEDADNAKERADLSTRLWNDLTTIYLQRTKGLSDEDAFVAPENAQVAQQVELILLAYGRKMPERFFNAIAELVVNPESRIQGLALLSSFLRTQTPHLYRVLGTPLVDHLLKCLMNDTSTTVLSMALTSLIMLLPHIPASLASNLPRLFLIYSRLLCWEKFSPLSTESQRELVTDDRIADSDEDERDDIGVDPNWRKFRSKPGLVEATTPEVMTLFTYLYGLYPLNFMSYIRKPRKYLKNVDFPGADDFDLDQTVIRSRSDQFRQVHILHPNFYNLTIDEELADPKWPKMEPADVVADCHGFCMNLRSPHTHMTPGPPPNARLPDLPPISDRIQGTLSPTMSHTSLRSFNSWKDTATAISGDAGTGAQSVLSDNDVSVEPLRLRAKSDVSIVKSGPTIDDFPPVPAMRADGPPPATNLAFLQRELTLLRNELNFERWHKAQYSQHIGQLMRKNVKDATVEAETLNLINANRTLKQQLEQVHNAREATLKDSALTRKQVNNLEANMAERLQKLKKEQEVWTADADELRRLRAEMKQYRDLLSAAEARELDQTHRVEIMKRDMESWEKLNNDLQEAKGKVRELQYKEFDYDTAKREVELLTSEKQNLHMRLQRHEQERDRMRKIHSDRIAELEAQAFSAQNPRRGSTFPGSDAQAAIAEANNKLAQLKKAHSRLLDKYTDLELEYSSVKSQLDELQGIDTHSMYPSVSRRNSIAVDSTMSGALLEKYPGKTPIGILESVYDISSDDNAGPDALAKYTSTSDPTSRRAPHHHGPGSGGGAAVPGPSTTNLLPASPPRSETTATPHQDPTKSGSINGGLSWKPSLTPQHHQQRHERIDSTTSSSRDSSSPFGGFNQTKPLTADERSMTDYDRSTDGRGFGLAAVGSANDHRRSAAVPPPPKIKPQSEVRVYGRGTFEIAPPPL
jgi:hypothetical protein